MEAGPRTSAAMALTSFAHNILVAEPVPRFNIKMSSYRYRKSHCGDKTVVRWSYLHNRISYTGKMTSLYWIGAQEVYWVSNYSELGHHWLPRNGLLPVWCQAITGTNDGLPFKSWIGSLWTNFNKKWISKIYVFLSTNCIWTYHLQCVDHVVPVTIALTWSMSSKIH